MQQNREAVDIFSKMISLFHFRIQEFLAGKHATRKTRKIKE